MAFFPRGVLPSSILFLTLAVLGVACGDGDAPGDAAPDEPFVPAAFGEWLKFEPEGAVCANGSQYKFFVNFSETSSDVVMFLEGGGACGDYDGCANGRPFNTDCIMGPPGETCIRDDYPAVYLRIEELAPLSAATAPLGVVDGNVPVELAYPLLSSNTDINPMGDWNKVFVPYCTGDTYLGSRVNTYVDPAGEGPDVEFHHMGHQNMLIVIEELNRMFSEVPRMMVGGCSAGGVGSLSNYPFIRNGIAGADRAYLLADSGPLMPGTLLNGQPGNAQGLNATRPLWGTDTLLGSLPRDSERALDDLSALNAIVSETFPDDRLSVSIFERDYNYTVSIYSPFFPIFAEEESSVGTGAGRTEIYRLTSEDLEALRAGLDELDNLSYYIPYYRNTNDSHCLTVTGLDDVGASQLEFIGAFQEDPSAATWSGTEIGTMTYKGFIEHVLDDSAPMQSYYEGTCEGRFQVCALDCDSYDAVMCEAAVQ
ncbi:MAG: pectin acetylesterase-family hydrolase [Myxococcota bacterium]